MPSLPDPLPENPLPLVEQWLAEAKMLPRRNPWALALATATAGSRPAVRFVLLKELSVDAGFLVFYTNYGSRKAAELESNNVAAAVMYWEELGRQLRFEGPVARSPESESDAYFDSRPRGSQLNAWASRQSRPVSSLREMNERLERHREELASRERIPRPRFWGGYRLWLASIELWCEGGDRFHERARYGRPIVPERPEQPVDVDAGWQCEYLQP